MELLKILTAVVTSTYMYKCFIHIIYVSEMPPISLYVWPNLGVWPGSLSLIFKAFWVINRRKKILNFFFQRCSWRTNSHSLGLCIITIFMWICFYFSRDSLELNSLYWAILVGIAFLVVSTPLALCKGKVVLLTSGNMTRGWLFIQGH